VRDHQPRLAAFRDLRAGLMSSAVTLVLPARMTLLTTDSAARTRSAWDSPAMSSASAGQRTPFAREPTLPRMTAAACLTSGKA
jgi:hypothetical protein